MNPSGTHFGVFQEPVTMCVVNRLVMGRCLLLAIVLISGASPGIPAPLIRYVRVEGNLRIPAAEVLARISEIPDKPLDRANIREDLKRLHNLGLFEEIKVIGRSTAHGQIGLVYRVCEQPLITDFSIEGVDESLEKELRGHLRKANLDPHPATPFDPSSAKQAALTVRNFLRTRKYPNAQVQISTEKQRNGVRVLLCVKPGMRLEIGAVRFRGNETFSESILLHQMRHCRPAPFWARWTGAARLVPEELNSDLERIRSYYMSHGFASVSIGKPRIFAVGGDRNQRLEIEIPVVEGARYSLISLGLEGSAEAGSADVQQVIRGVETPCDYDYSLLETTRQKIAEALGRHGYAMARVQLMQSINEIDQTVEAVYRLEAGDSLTIGRIMFQGNPRIPDRFLRRELRLEEGDQFSTAKLDESVAHLNKSGLANDVIRSDVALKVDPKTNLLDITFRVKEKDRQGIYLTGGSGGIGGGYLGILYTAFNVMRLGEILSLELDGGASQSNILLNMVGNRFLGSPFTLALSLFNTTTGLNVAGIVPGPDDVIEVFRRRSTGAGLSGTYSLTDGLQADLDFKVKEDSVNYLQAVDSVPSRLESELAPSISLNHTSGSGMETRGFRAIYSQAWTGSSFLKSLDSMRESAQLTYYARDRWTRGRNSFAFRLQFGRVRPIGGKALPLEQRFYPGNDIVRGFDRGSLSPWAAMPGDPDPVFTETLESLEGATSRA